MQDEMRTYLGLAMGLTETSRKKVRKVVKDAVGRSNATADQVRALSSDLLAANSANREALVKLVKFEVDRALGVVGLATAEEVAELTDRLHALEAKLREVGARGSAPAPAATAEPTTPATRAEPSRARAAASRSAAGKRTTAKATASKTAPRGTAASKAAPARAGATRRGAKATGAKATGTKATGAKAAGAKASGAKATKAAAKASPARSTGRRTTTAKAQP